MQSDALHVARGSQLSLSAGPMLAESWKNSFCNIISKTCMLRKCRAHRNTVSVQVTPAQREGEVLRILPVPQSEVSTVAQRSLCVHVTAADAGSWACSAEFTPPTESAQVRRIAARGPREVRMRAKAFTSVLTKPMPPGHHSRAIRIAALVPRDRSCPVILWQIPLDHEGSLQSEASHEQYL